MIEDHLDLLENLDLQDKTAHQDLKDLKDPKANLVLQGLLV